MKTPKILIFKVIHRLKTNIYVLFKLISNESIVFMILKPKSYRYVEKTIKIIFITSQKRGFKKYTIINKSYHLLKNSNRYFQIVELYLRKSVFR